MLEKGTSGLMSGEGKRAAASRPRTALFLDSTSGHTDSENIARLTRSDGRALSETANFSVSQLWPVLLVN